MSARRQRNVGNLPAEAGELIGRRSELVELRLLCGESRLVTLVGVGGVGKTRLALRAAAEEQPSLRDGAWWVELSALRQGALLAHTIAEALPLADQPTRPMIDVVADYLADRELLLVLDTCEHLVDECALAAEALLRAAPGLRILVTSRRPLGIAAERLLTVAPLPVPEDDDENAAMGEAEAVALLAVRAAEAVPGFAVTDANRPELVRLCRRLDGLPLAIELAAARLRELSVAELTDRLEDRFAVLGTTEKVVHEADPPWHQALRTAIGWSHELCAPAERLAWARLSVFAGGFDAEAARAVCADVRLPAAAIPALLDALVDKSIVTWVPTGGGERYRMLDTIREFGTFWLRTLGEERALRRRHRQFYQALARRCDAGWMGPDQVTWYGRTVAEHANLRAALDFCLTEGDGRTALEMSGELWFFWLACGHAREGRHYLDQALELSTGPEPARGKALWACGMVAALVQGDPEASGRLAGDLWEAVAGEADATAVLAAAHLEGTSLTLSGHLVRAAEVLDAVPRNGPVCGRYDAAWFLLRVARAYIHIHLGQFAEAGAAADELRAACARRGETWARSWADYVHALAALGLGRAEEAAAHARTALHGKRHLHDSLGIATAVDLLASAATASGRAERAARLLGIAGQVWHTLGMPQVGIPELAAARQACEHQARLLIGDDAYDTAFDAGYGAASDTGIAYALNAPESPLPPPPHAPVN